MVARMFTASDGCVVRCRTWLVWVVGGAVVATAAAAAGAAATAGVSGQGAAGAAAGSGGVAVAPQRILRLRLGAGSRVAGPLEALVGLRGGSRIELAAVSKMCCSGCGAVGEGAGWASAAAVAVVATVPPCGVKAGAYELGPAPEATLATASAMVLAAKKWAGAGWSATVAAVVHVCHATCAGGASTAMVGQRPAWPAARAAASHASSYAEQPRLKFPDVPTHHLAHWSQLVYTPQPCSGL